MDAEDYIKELEKRVVDVVNPAQQNTGGQFKKYGVSPVVASFVIILVIALAVGIIYISSRQNTVPSTTFYTQSVTNVRDCSSKTCNVIGQLSLNTSFDLTYKTIVDLPDWIQISFQNNSGENKTGYISKSVLGLSKVNTADNLVQSTATETYPLQQPSIQTQTPSQPKDLSYIVREWKPRVGQIFCSWYIDNVYDSGSGLLINYDNQPAILTNYHVINYNGYAPNYCSVWFYSTGSIISGNPTQNGSKVNHNLARNDWGLFTPDNSITSEYIKNLASQPFSVCSRDYSGDISIGDNVAIIGYPTIGSKMDVTVTRGIISGIDGNYYITDAKIDHGNSGGLAIDKDNNCYFGIPTWDLSGSFESLGRILPALSFLNY